MRHDLEHPAVLQAELFNSSNFAELINLKLQNIENIQIHYNYRNMIRTIIITMIMSRRAFRH